MVNSITGKKNVGRCIYCGVSEYLTDEHVMPFGLGGTMILGKASCKDCARITGPLEQRLLRGQWWPYRKKLGLRTRSKSYPAYCSVTLKQFIGEPIDAKIRSEEYPFVVFVGFDPPSILAGSLRGGYPVATQMFGKSIAQMPSRVLVDGQIRALRHGEQIEFPMHFDCRDVVRFLAKVAHGYAIYSRGAAACSEYFLPEYILGNGDGALTYVGGATSPVLGTRLPGTSVHALMDRVQGEYLSVYLQLFRDDGDPPPIYEVVVGRLQATVL